MGATRSLAAILFTHIVGYTAVAARSQTAALELCERHRKLVGESVARFRGRFFEEAGDESLSTFASAADAVACAMAVQEELASHGGPRLRVSIHLGEVEEQDGHLIGDAVKVARRIRRLAEPGGVCVSSPVWENVGNLAGLDASFLGDMSFEHLQEPLGVWALRGEGLPAPTASQRRTWLRLALLGAGALFLLVAVFASIQPAREAVVLGLVRANAVHVLPSYDQEIHFTESSDGVRLAWASIGEGPAVVNVAGWPSHLERGLGSPGNNVVVPALMGTHRVLVYDGRGFGLSEHGVADLSLEARVRDVEAVLDAAGVERASVIGISSAALPAVALAALRPERVERLLVYGAASRFGYSPSDPSVRARALALADLMRAGSDQTDPAFRHIFSSLFMPDADPFMVRVFDELQRVSGSPADIADFLEATIEIDIEELAPRVQAPTLIVHVRGDELVPDEEVRRLASLIPNAELLTFEGRNHLPMPGDAWAHASDDVIRDFMSRPLP